VTLLCAKAQSMDVIFDFLALYGFLTATDKVSFWAIVMHLLCDEVVDMNTPTRSGALSGQILDLTDKTSMKALELPLFLAVDFSLNLPVTLSFLHR